MRKAISSIVIAFLILASLLEVASVAAQPSQKVQVIVGFKGKTDAGLIRRHGGDVKHEYSTISAVACSLPQGAIDALERNPNIAYIELDGKVQMTQELPPGLIPTPFDGVDRIDADLVHESFVTGAGVKVAIIDTGIDYNHPDLNDNYVGGIDYVNDDDDPIDDNGHGTHCAGIVAAEANAFGVIGVAPEAWLYGVKVLDATGSGYVSDVTAGIDWSIDNGMHIISMSLGTTTDYQAVHDICDAAYYTHGILVVAAAGNDYRIRGRKELDTVSYPARYDSVIAVGATDNTDTRASYSSTGSALELVAPGENIKSTFLGGTYMLLSGTSMACPHVSGTAALLLSKTPTPSASAVRSKMQDTADDLGSSGWDSWYGYGLVDANAMPSAPSITRLAPAVGAFINTATPTISATVKDANGIKENSIGMTLDGGSVIGFAYDSGTGLVSYVVPSLGNDRPTVTLTASDNLGNADVTSWSFTVDTIAPAQVTGVTVTPVSSSALYVSWDESTDPDLAFYSVYRSEDGTGYTRLNIFVLPCSETDREGFPNTGLEPGKTYWYQIAAWDIAGNEGPRSDPASGTTATPAGGVMHINRIEMMWSYGSGTSPKHKSVYAEAWVWLVDADGVPVEGATVKGHWEGATTDSDSGVTGANGWAMYIRSDTVRDPPSGTTFTFVVDTVVKEGWTYDRTKNVETFDSVTYP